MSPEANVQEKLTVTMAPPPAALAADKKKAQARKRTEAENLIDGHAAGIKSDRLSDEEKARTIAKQGRTGGLVGFALFAFVALRTITHYGGWLHATAEGSTVRYTLEQAYHRLNDPWFFDLSTRLWQFRIFSVLSVLFLLFALAIPRQFGKFWMGLGHVLGSIMTPVFLTVLFFVGVAPVALVLRVIGSDPLRRSKHDGTYWIPREKQREMTHFERRF